MKPSDLPPRRPGKRSRPPESAPSNCLFPIFSRCNTWGWTCTSQVHHFCPIWPYPFGSPLHWNVAPAGLAGPWALPEDASLAALQYRCGCIIISKQNTRLPPRSRCSRPLTHEVPHQNTNHSSCFALYVIYYIYHIAYNLGARLPVRVK